MVALGSANGAVSDSKSQPSTRAFWKRGVCSRIGSLTKKLKKYTEKERELWAICARKPFETGIAKPE